MNKNMKKPLATAIGAAFLASAALPAMADSNPFTARPLNSGYDLVSKAQAEGKCGEGACGAEMGSSTAIKSATEGKCGDMEKCKAEGKCGDAKKCDAEVKAGGKCMTEGKCGDAKKCDHDVKKLEQIPAVDAKNAASDKAMKEGSCGDM